MSLLFTNLCAEDLIVILIQVPLEIVWTATVSWFAGDFMCRIMVLLRIFGFYLSGFVMIVISLDRLSAILYPITHRSSTARTKLMLGVSWVLSLLCSLPQCFVFRLKKHPIQDDYLQCTTFGYFDNRDMELLFFIFVFTLTWVLPLTVMIICYSTICFVIFRRCCQLDKTSANVTSSLKRVKIGGVFGRAKLQSLKVTGLLVLGFVVCWTPYNVMSLW